MKAIVALVLMSAITAPTAAPAARSVLPNLDAAKAHNVTLQPAGDHVQIKPTSSDANADHYAVLPNTDFTDGVLEADLKADVLPGSAADIRAFVGLAFRLNDQGYEAFYLRMKNGRARDQVQRNHSTQYISFPDYPWERLRKEAPGAYESYVDLVPGRWTHVRVTVCKAEARLYVDGAAQPALVVHDLKHGPSSRGQIALWVGPGADATFRTVKITSIAVCPPLD